MLIQRTLVVLVCCSCLVWAQEKSGLQKAHFLGPVHTVHVERITVTNYARGSAPVSDETFDTHGNITQSVSYRDAGVIEQKVQWGHTSDKRGHILEVRYFNTDGDLTNTGLYRYPSDEHTVELVHVNPDGSTNHKAVFYTTRT